MAEVEADADVAALEIVLEQSTSDAGARQIGSGSLRAPRGRRAARPAADLLDAAERGGPAVVARLASRRRHAEVHDEDVERNAARDAQRGSGLAHRRLPPRVVRRRRSRARSPQRPPAEAVAIGACMLCSVSPVSVQPLRELARSPPRRGSRSACASRTPRPPRTHTRRSAPDARAQPAVVKEMRGDPEAHAARSAAVAELQTSHSYRRWPGDQPGADAVLPEFLDVRREQLAQAGEPGQVLEVVAHVAQRARDVLDVDGIARARSSGSRTCRAP